MDRFYAYQRARQTVAAVSDSEERGLSIIQGAWVHAQNSGLDPKVLHPRAVC